MGNVCQGGVGQAPARQATIFAGKFNICNILLSLYIFKKK